MHSWEAINNLVAAMNNFSETDLPCVSQRKSDWFLIDALKLETEASPIAFPNFGSMTTGHQTQIRRKFSLSLLTLKEIFLSSSQKKTQLRFFGVIERRMLYLKRDISKDVCFTSRELPNRELVFQFRASVLWSATLFYCCTLFLLLHPAIQWQRND